MSRFWIIVAALLMYTCFKVTQVWPGHGAEAVMVSAAVFVVMLASLFISRSHDAVFEKKWFRALAWLGSLTMAAWATFIILSIPMDLAAAVSSAAGHPLATQKIETVLLGFAIVFAAAGFLQVVGGPRVKRVNVHVPGLAPGLRGLTIAHISDLHVGPTLRKNYVDDAVRKINEVKPDLVVFTGDLADGPASSISAHLEPLGRIESRYGAFYVTGNHEYYWDAAALIDQVKRFGFIPLLNQNATVSVNGKNVMVAGVTDPVGEMIRGHKPDLPKAAFSADQVDLKILLAHRPGVAEQAEPFGFHLQLSGHTHAGQFFPFNFLIGFFHKYSRGLYRHGRMSVYVNPGTGYWGPASRLGVSPEISLLTIENGAS